MKTLCDYLLIDHKMNYEMKWLVGWAKGELAPSYFCEGFIQFGEMLNLDSNTLI
jgi:hypothetical protein